MSSLHGQPRLGIDENKTLIDTFNIEIRISEIEKIEEKIGQNKVLWQRKESLRNDLFELTLLEAPSKWLENLVDKSNNY